MIVKQFFYKRSTNHYSHMRCASPPLPVVETAPKEMKKILERVETDQRKDLKLNILSWSHSLPR